MRYLLIGTATGLAAAALAMAAPANAELAPGLYNFKSVMANGTVTDIRMQVNSCGPGCLDLVNLDLNEHQGQATIQGTQYVLEKFVPAGAFCNDGRTVDVQTRYTFNLDGTNGVYNLNGPNPCGNDGPVGVTTFTLTPL